MTCRVLLTVPGVATWHLHDGSDWGARGDDERGPVHVEAQLRQTRLVHLSYGPGGGENLQSHLQLTCRDIDVPPLNLALGR